MKAHGCPEPPKAQPAATKAVSTNNRGVEEARIGTVGIVVRIPPIYLSDREPDFYLPHFVCRRRSPSPDRGASPETSETKKDHEYAKLGEIEIQKSLLFSNCLSLIKQLDHSNISNLLKVDKKIR